MVEKVVASNLSVSSAFNRIRSCLTQPSENVHLRVDTDTILQRKKVFGLISIRP